MADGESSSERLAHSTVLGSTDIGYLDVLHEEDWQRWFEPGTIDALLAEHVWEHLTLAEGKLAARHCLRYLCAGGYLRAAVPDGSHPNLDYVKAVKVGGSGPSADDHKMLYTYETLSEVFRDGRFQTSPSPRAIATSSLSVRPGTGFGARA
jgi:predicted SAM-dependent methyltransferase